MIRLFDLARWVGVEAGEQVLLGVEGSPVRTVQLTVQAPEGCRAMIADQDGSAVVVAIPAGEQRIQFAARGQASLEFSAPVSYFSDDGLVVEVKASPDAYSFTKIANRKARNYEMELMQFKAEMNMRARMEHLEREYEERIANLERGQFDRETGEEGRREAPASSRQSQRKPERRSTRGEPEGDPEVGDEPAAPEGSGK